MNEREEMQADEERKAAERAEAISEAMRILPMAADWCVVAVMPDGNPAIIISCPRYNNAVCIQQVSAAVIKNYIADSFQTGPTQQL